MFVIAARKRGAGVDGDVNARLGIALTSELAAGPGLNPTTGESLPIRENVDVRVGSFFIASSLNYLATIPLPFTASSNVTV